MNLRGNSCFILVDVKLHVSTLQLRLVADCIAFPESFVFQQNSTYIYRSLDEDNTRLDRRQLY